MRKLPDPPARIKTLPRDVRGYPIPWFVYRDENGKHDFRIMDGRKFYKAIRANVCWVCGKPLGTFKVFVIGPMCAVNRISAEPPSHRECAEYSAQVCPFLSLPHAKRREANLPEGHENPAGTMIKRNPGVTLLWVTRSYGLIAAGEGHLLEIGEPVEVHWYREGRQATRQEVLDAIESGMPLLRAPIPEGDTAAFAALDKAHAAALQHIPAY